MNIEDPESMITFELDESPKGEHHILKRLTFTEYAGQKFYELYEWAPNPENDGIEEYVQTYGIELSEDELKDIYRELRKELFEMYQGQGPDPDDIVESDEVVDISAFIDDDDDEEEDNLVTFEDEAKCSFYMGYLEFPSGCRFTLMSWGDDIDETVGFDIRIWEERINRIGHMESFPIIYKGVNLNMYESEMFCQAVEELFPDLAEELSRYRDKDWNEKMDTVDLKLSDADKELALTSFYSDLHNVQEEFCKRINRGSTIGIETTEHRQKQVQQLATKIENNERLTDEEILTCSSFFDATANTLKENGVHTEVSDGLTFLTKRFDNIIDKREQLFSAQEWKTKRTKIDYSLGESDTASDVLVLIRQLLYVEQDVTPQKIAEFKKNIDTIVLQDITTRNAYLMLDSSFQENPGMNFIDDLILAFLYSSELE